MTETPLTLAEHRLHPDGYRLAVAVPTLAEAAKRRDDATVAGEDLAARAEALLARAAERAQKMQADAAAALQAAADTGREPTDEETAAVAVIRETAAADLADLAAEMAALDEAAQPLRQEAADAQAEIDAFPLPTDEQARVTFTWAPDPPPRLLDESGEPIGKPMSRADYEKMMQREAALLIRHHLALAAPPTLGTKVPGEGSTL